MMLMLLLFTLQTQQPKQMVLPELGFSMAFPEAWLVKNEKERGPMAGVAELPPRRALCLLTREPLPEGQSNEKAVEEHLKSLAAQFKDPEVLYQKNVKLGPTLEAVNFDVRVETKGRKLRYLTYMFSAFNERFLLQFVTQDDLFANQEAEFKTIVAGLKLTGPPNFELTSRFLTQIQAEATNYERLSKLLLDGADINGRDIKGRGALFFAVYHRKGLLLKWLLEKGAKLQTENQDSKLVHMIASPPIREYLKRQLAAANGQTYVPSTAGPIKSGLSVTYSSTQAQLFSGIKNGQLEVVTQALQKGADLKSLDKNYRLPALALTQQLIKEFEELNLDASIYKPIEKFLRQKASTPR